jgi:hypothetical protein
MTHSILACGVGTYVPGGLLPKDDRRPTDSFPFEVDVYLDAVGYPDERNAAVHPELLAVERHGPSDGARARTFAGNGKYQLLGFCYSADSKIAVEFKGVGAGLRDLR